MPGSPARPYYYGVDQLGSVRRAFASTSSAPAYAYDPYGVPLQVTAPVTDFGYAGLFNHPASGLNLTLYRGYDPVAGRWLSRDPLGEPSDPYGNLYAYVGGNTPNLIDPTGENPFAIAGAAGGFLGGFAGSVAGQLYNDGCVRLGQALGDAVEGAGIGSAGGLLASIFRRAAIALAGRTVPRIAGTPTGGTTFKTSHYARRLDAEGVGVARAETAVSRIVAGERANIGTSAPFSGRLSVDGKLIEYHGMRLPNGNINIGTIFPVR